MKVKNHGQNSSIVLFFNNVAKSVDKLFRASAFYKFFHSYDKSEQQFNSSFIYNSLNISTFAAKRRMFKNNFAKQCESSLIVVFIKNFYNILLNCKIRAFAVVLMCMSIYSMLFGVMKYALLYSDSLFNDTNFISVLLFIVSLIFVPTRSSIPEFANKSRIISFIKKCFFADDKEAFDYKSNAYMPSFGTLFIIGTALGILTIVFPIKYIIYCIFCLFILLSLFKTPENGLPFILLITPFCSINVLSLFSVMAFSAYLFKLMRCKRSFSFKYFDLLILLFAAIVLCASRTSAFGGEFNKDALTMLLFVLMYFLVRNCIKTEIMVGKLCNAMSFSGAVVALSFICTKMLFIYENTIPYINNTIKRFSFVQNVFSSDIAIGEFILIIIPFIFTSFALSGKKQNRSFNLIALLLCVFAVCATQSKGLIAALFITILIYATSSFRSPVTSLLTVVFVCVVLAVFITNSGFLGNDRFFFVNDYKNSLWNTTSEIIADNFVSGIGLGKSNFAQVLAAYNDFSTVHIDDCCNWYLQLFAQVGVFGFLFYAYISVSYFKMQFTLLNETRNKNAFSSLISIAAISSVFSMYLRGLTSYIWTEPKVFFAFFVIVGISASVYYINSDKKIAYEKGI